MEILERLLISFGQKLQKNDGLIFQKQTEMFWKNQRDILYIVNGGRRKEAVMEWQNQNL